VAKPVDAAVYFEGLDEFRKGLKNLDAAYPKKLSAINKRMATSIVPDVQRRYAHHFESRRGRTTGSIKGKATQRQIAISVGTPSLYRGAKAENVAKGQEFGSNAHRQFAPWTGKGPSGKGSRGRFLWPAVRDAAPKVADEYLGELEKLAAEVMPRG
jgi:hypothetical protein